MAFGLNAFQASDTTYGSVTDQGLAELTKALEAGYQTGPGATGGSALRVESLEASLKVLTYTSNQIKFWKKIPKSPAFSTVEEYNQLTDYGGEASPFVLEGELPQSTDASYIRRTQLMKYMGTVREVTHQATLVHPASGDLIALSNQTGILWLLRQIERNLFEGDASLAFSGEGAQWNGLDAFIDPTSTIDMEGQTLTEAAIEAGTNQIVEAYGVPTDLFLNTKASSDLTKTFYPRERIQMPAPVNGQVGLSIDSMMTQAGGVQLNPDIFVRMAPSPSAVATSANAPATPASVAVGSPTGTTGDHDKGAPSGTTYFAYVVTSNNRFGESAPTAFAGGATALTQVQKDAGNYLPLTITNPSIIGAYAPEFIRIYRSACLAL